MPQRYGWLLNHSQYILNGGIRKRASHEFYIFSFLKRTHIKYGHPSFDSLFISSHTTVFIYIQHSPSTHDTAHHPTIDSDYRADIDLDKRFANLSIMVLHCS